MLSILCGHWRYVHVSALCEDHVNEALPEMDKVVSKDLVRGTLAKMAESGFHQAFKRTA